MVVVMASILISTVSLLLSITVAWLTLFRRGTIRMTQPTVIFFGPDGGSRSSPDNPLPKVFLRTLLFCTSKRGRIIEGMHVALSRNETHQNFNVWVYGNEKLVRGSGLFVGETGRGGQSSLSLSKGWELFSLYRGSLQAGCFRPPVG